MRTMLYEAANVMLTRYKGELKLKGGPSRSPSEQRAQSLARRLGIIMHAMLRDGTEFASA